MDASTFCGSDGCILTSCHPSPTATFIADKPTINGMRHSNARYFPGHFSLCIDSPSTAHNVHAIVMDTMNTGSDDAGLTIKTRDAIEAISKNRFLVENWITRFL